MIMRLAGIAIISAIVGACVAAVPVPVRIKTMQPITNPTDHYHGSFKHRIDEPQVQPRLDPEIDSRLNSLEQKARELRDSVTPPTKNVDVEH